MSDTSVAVSWELLTLEEARGFVTGYTVTFGARRRSNEPISVGSSTSRVVLNGLDPRLAYWVSVSGSTAAGISTNNTRILIEPSLGKVHSYFLSQKLHSHFSPVDGSTAHTVTAIVTSVVVIVLTAISLLVATLVTVLVMMKCLNKQKREQDGVYEMHGDGKPADTKYDVLDHN